MEITSTQFLKLKMANMAYWKASYIDFHFEANNFSQKEVQALIYKTIETLYDCNTEMIKSAIEITKNHPAQIKRKFLENFSDNKGTLQYIIGTLGPEFTKELLESDYNKHSKESSNFICKYIDFYKEREKTRTVVKQKN